ncbi:MAG TPA: hypothetical protein VFS54_11115 [Solirubrobacterales bacterium]|nr:hypothetical protein [Solirubrobacterales bacterium]
MSRLRRLSKPLTVLVALIAVALVFSACAFFKPGSLALSQPGGVGSVRVHFALCTEPEPNCSPSEDTKEVQYLLGIAVPPGSTPPSTVTAVPVGGGSPLVFTLNNEVATEIAVASANLKKLAEKEGEGDAVPPPWPPAGLQGVGYLSNAHLEQKGVQYEWSADADFGLPAAADGSPFSGPFATGLSLGFRQVNPGQSASRPVDCWGFETEPPESDAFCFGTALQGQVGTSDLKIAAPAKASAFLGGKAKIPFPFNFATTTSPSPSFALSATSTLPKGKLTLGSPTFTPGVIDPTTHRAPTANQTVTVNVPKNAKPGTYDVTVTAKTPQGGTVSQVAKLKVSKAKLSLGGAKLNKAKGTATLSVKIPGAGTVTASGNGVVKAKKSAKKAKKAKTLKLTIKTKGKAKKQLAEEGTAKVKVKVTFKPTSGTSVTKTKNITLKQN